MNPILPFLIKKHFKKALLSDYRYEFFTYSLVIIITSLLSGLLLSHVYDFNIREQVIEPRTFLLWMNSIFAVSFLLIGFVPAFKKNLFLFPNHYPIKRVSKTIIALFFYSFNYFIFYVYSTLIFLVIFSNEFSFIILIFSFVYIFNGYLVNRILKNIIEYTVPGSRKIIFYKFGSFFLFCSYLYFFSSNIAWDSIGLFGFFIILLICFSLSENDKRIKKDSFPSSILPFKSYFIQLLSGASLSRTYLPAFLFKVLWLLVATLTLNSNGKPPFGNNLTMWMFASTLIIILYSGINIFGRSKDLFFTHIIREYSIQNLAKSYIKLVGFLLLIDGFIFWTFLIANELYNWQDLLFYYTTFIVLPIAGFWFSLHRPNFTDNNLFFNLAHNKEESFPLSGAVVIIVLYFFVEWIRYSDHQLILTVLLISFLFIGAFCYRYNFSTISHNAYHRMKNL